MTQLESARAGKITREMERVAEREGLGPEFILQGHGNSG
jgi:thiamine biosynthesis protein ThiC